MKKTEFSQHSFNNIQELIKFADQKSGAILVIVGIMLTVFVEFSKKLNITSLKDSSFAGVITFIFGFSFILISIITIYIVIFKILKPRLAENYTENEKSILYFEHLALMGKETIKEKFSLLSDDQILNLLNDQNTENSKILVKKIDNLNCSFNLLFTSIILLILFVFTSIYL